MTLTVAKIIECQCQMIEWVWSIGRIILTVKNQNTQRKTWASVVRGPRLTVTAIYLRWEKCPKYALYCTDQPQCVYYM